MMTNSSQWYPASWGGLAVTGADARDFLQGQLSHDLGKSQPQALGWSSYNSPKGRVLAVLRVRTTEQGFELLMPPSLVERVGKRLRMFVLRAKVEIAERPAPDAGCAPQDRLSMIEAGLPVVYPETQDQWVAQMLNLDSLGGIAFDKGCYTGQEVIARLHYLGKLKRRMYRLQGHGDAPAPGTEIVNLDGDGQSVGSIVDAVAQGDGFVASAVIQSTLEDCATLALAERRDQPLQPPAQYAYADA